MSLDTTNSEMLDVSPFSDDFSYFNYAQPPSRRKKAKIIQRIIERKRQAAQAAQAAQASQAAQAAPQQPMPVAVNQPSTGATATPVQVSTQPRPIARPIARPVARPISKRPIIKPAEKPSLEQKPVVEKEQATDKMPKTQPLPSKEPVIKPTEAQGEKPEIVTDTKGGVGTTDKESPAFFKSYWFWGVVIGAAAGYFYAKNKNKAMLTSLFVGGALGGAVGFGAETFGKPKAVTGETKPSAANVKPTTDNEAPEGEAQEEAQQEAGETNVQE